MKRVVLGMSGGVDSSVAAYLLKEQGFEVVGVSLLLFETRGRTNPRTCCSLESVRAAEQTCSLFNIPHRMVNAREEFIEKVIDPFVQGYLKGVTPNPCVLCNQHIKFPLLEQVAREVDAEFISTGHYAKTVKINGKCLLAKASDSAKDQSYFLYVLKPETLAHTIFPLGYMEKTEVRELARKLHLPSANRVESVEICFIGETGYAGFIKEIAPEAEKPGPIFDIHGNQIGTHTGIFNYTMGQRRGINIPHTEPLYVIKISPEKNAIYVGQRELAFRKSVYVKDVNWLSEPVERITAKVRSMMKDEPAHLLNIQSDRCILQFDRPQWAPAPGQSAVFYHQDIVIGGGIIVEEEYEMDS